MLKSAAASCTDDNPCRHYDPCARCQAGRYLSEDDWLLIGFYRTVQDQIDGMSGAPRLDGYSAAVELHGYPPELRSWLVQGAAMLARLISKQDQVDWLRELGKPMRYVTAAELIDG
jgi:hypothetical protein